MKTDMFERRVSGTHALVPALALVLLLGAGCSEKETTATQEAAPEPQMAEPAAPPPVEETAPAAEPPAAEAPAAEPPTAEPPAAEAPTAEPPAAAAEAATQTASVDGQKIYQASCQACHVAGVAGAPKLGDKAAWAPRIAKGNDALYSSVKNGLNAMPPKGGCMSCGEDELRAAVDYMVSEGS
jgi:cytochrome c5